MVWPCVYSLLLLPTRTSCMRSPTLSALSHLPHYAHTSRRVRTAGHCDHMFRTAGANAVGCSCCEQQQSCSRLVGAAATLDPAPQRTHTAHFPNDLAHSSLPAPNSTPVQPYCLCDTSLSSLSLTLSSAAWRSRARPKWSRPSITPGCAVTWCRSAHLCSSSGCDDSWLAQACMNAHTLADSLLCDVCHEQGAIPGIGEASIAKLKAEPWKIDTPDRLVAVYFHKSRNADAAIDFLETEVRIQRQFAEKCIRNFEKKYGHHSAV